MAQATIKITDNEDGTLNVNLDFEPAMDTEEEPTLAQSMAMALVSGINEAMSN